MKKMYLIKNQQYGVTSYVGSIDPRVLVRLADQSIEIGQVQEDQRPLDKKHIQNLEDAKNVDTINGETLFSIPSSSLSFRGEGATVKLAEDDGNLLKVFVANKQTAGFNPFD